MSSPSFSSLFFLLGVNGTSPDAVPLVFCRLADGWRSSSSGAERFLPVGGGVDGAAGFGFRGGKGRVDGKTRAGPSAGWFGLQRAGRHDVSTEMEGYYRNHSRKHANSNLNSGILALIVHNREELAPGYIQAFQCPLKVLVPIRVAQHPRVLVDTHITLPEPARLPALTQDTIDELAERHTRGVAAHLRVRIAADAAERVRGRHADRAERHRGLELHVYVTQRVVRLA